MISPTEDIPEQNRDYSESCEETFYKDLKAREEIILKHLYLAKRYSSEYAGRGVPTKDLYQEGCYGLIVALNRFDPNHGAPFSSYATHYVLKYIRQALLEQNTRYPARYNQRLFAEIKRYCAAYETLSASNMRTPSDQEIADYLGRSHRHVRNLKLAAHQFLTSAKNIEDPSAEIVASITAAKSLHPVEDTVLKGILDPDLPDVHLTKREEEVLSRRLGFTESGKPETWKDISTSMSLSIQWLQKIYAIAIDKLQNSSKIQSRAQKIPSQN